MAPGHSLPWGHTRGTGMSGQSLGHNRGHREQPELLAQHHGSTPVPGITFCPAPDPTTPMTDSQSLQGPSGPSAVPEMQIKGCGFEKTIKEDLHCPVEHLQATGEFIPRAARSATTCLPRQLSRPFSIPVSPWRGWSSLEHSGVSWSGDFWSFRPTFSQHKHRKRPGGVQGQSPCDPRVHPGQS